LREHAAGAKAQLAPESHAVSRSALRYDCKRHRPHEAGGLLQNPLSSFVIGCTRVRLRHHMQAPYMVPILVSVKAEIGESGTEKSYYQYSSKTGCDDKRRIVEIKRPSNRAISAPFLELPSFPFICGVYEYAELVP